MAESLEARWLRVRWNEEYLGRYRDQWIAVRGEEIVAYGQALEVVLEEVKRQEQGLEAALIAFVVLDDLQ